MENDDQLTLALGSALPKDYLLTILVESARDYAIFVLDPRGYIKTWNEGARRIKGYESSEIIGKHFSIFYPQEDKCFKPEFELKTAWKEGRFEDEGWRLRNDGSRFWANVIITPLCDKQGNLLGFAKITRDLTERNNHEEALRKAHDEAVRASKLKSQFVANISHEVRTPMAGIIGMAEVLLHDARLDDEQKDTVQHIFSSGERLLSVLNDLLDFSKLEAGRMELQEVELSLSELLDNVCGTLEPIAKKKNIAFKCILRDSLPQRLIGDSEKIQQVLLNLGHNAIKFTQEGGVTVSASLKEQYDQVIVVHFSIEDTGIGVDSSWRDRLFQPFVQVNGTSSRKFVGTGLGLSIVKGFVTLMRGDIGFQSEPGRGSDFWFDVPLRLAPHV